jgi:hypothetical protein
VQEHQGEKARRLGPPRHELDQHPAQADRLAAQLAPHQPFAQAGRVSFIEGEVDHRHDAGEARGQGLVGRHSVGNAGGPDLGLGADQALREGWNRDHERACDLLGREAAERPEGQRQLGLGGEGVVATGEDEAQTILVHRSLLVGASEEMALQLVAQCFEPTLPPDAVDGLVPGCGDEPGHGILGRAVAGHLSTAAAKASWTASSERSKSPTRRMTVARTRP